MTYHADLRSRSLSAGLIRVASSATSGGWPGLNGSEFVDMEPVREYHFNNFRESRERRRVPQVPPFGTWVLGWHFLSPDFDYAGETQPLPRQPAWVHHLEHFRLDSLQDAMRPKFFHECGMCPWY
jgi:hypothetical protein